ncbi:MAG: VWA domain-containing protein [Flavobacteriales bacterium]|nr:VWA domain-containing protein [Flavobacteriales bacterium]
MHPYENAFRLTVRQLGRSLTAFCLLWSVVQVDVKAEILPTLPNNGSPIDIVFVIDISGSTGGILSSVRGKFWEIQNEMARLSPTPNYRLGIVCMGRPSFKSENNYVQIISDLTNDIDAAAYPFYQIKDVSAPGNYFMGHALDVAVNSLNWSKDPNAIRMMFVAGNGKPSAGPGFNKPIRDAQEKGITVHSLYFMTYSNDKEQQDWNEMAAQTGGSFNIIGLKEPAIVLEKSYDGAMLREASHMINTTYVYYGNSGISRFEMQADLDEEAELQGENQVEARTFFKVTGLYQGLNASWDLIDLENTGGEALKQSTKFMDPRLNELSNDEFLMHLAEVGYERKEYISIIKMLSTQREQFLREKREKLENYRFGKTFFGVVNRTIVETAEKHGYSLDY